MHATDVWLEKRERVDTADPLFEILDELDRHPRNRARTPQKKTTRIEGRSGSAAEIKFSDPPDCED